MDVQSVVVKARLVLSELILQKPIKFNFSENCGIQHFS